MNHNATPMVLTAPNIVNASRPVFFVDYEGTIASSIIRHYHQYVEALRRLSIHTNVSQPSLLKPCLMEFFIEQYPKRGFDVRAFVADDQGEEAAGFREQLKRTFQDIIWEYSPSFQKYERLLPGAAELLRELNSLYDINIVSYTRQDQQSFRDHLRAMGLFIDAAGVPAFTVGADGQTSREAKQLFIQSRFGTRLHPGPGNPRRAIMVADSVSDLEVAVALGIDFVGVTQTGQGKKDAFQSYISSISSHSNADVEYTLFDSIDTPELRSYVINRLAGPE